ncbi:MAG: AI-2E family transporter [Bacteroidia bacterium]|nr:AI-2E family transporter [Bacteroidia bacterium]MCC7532606.1 AI-2E family transporter [Bacteroidia bacterium]
MPNSFPINRKTIAFIALNIFGIFIIYSLKEFITPFLGALMFYVLFLPFMDYLVIKRRWKDSSAAIVIIAISLVIILIPTLLTTNLLYNKITSIVNNPNSFIHSIQEIDIRIREITGRQIITPEIITKLQENISVYLPTFLNKVFLIIGNIAMMYFMLYFMLVQREKMQEEVKKYLPFKEENLSILAKELETQTQSNAIAVPLIAVIQGTAAGIGYWIFGLKEPLFWGVITAFVSIIPIAGSTIIWVPAAIFIMITGNIWMGLGLVAYGTIVIINIDNIARLTIQKKFADVHPIITVFGVIIGLNLFGIPGLIFGPLMLSYFLIFIKMYRDKQIE